MLVSMSVPLSQNCSLYYLSTIANKFYFDQVTSASKEKCKYLAVSSISLTSICFLIVCLLGCKWMLDVNECCHLSLSGQPLDEASVSASSKADVIPINYSENCIISGPSWGDSLSPTSPFELRLFRYLIRATLYVLASCWYKQPKNVNGSGKVPVDTSSCFQLYGWFC